jgi:hypothetical protein
MYLGHISAERPSTVVNASRCVTADMNGADAGPIELMIGVSIEPVAALLQRDRDAEIGNLGTHSQLACNIARDLDSFISSFARPTRPGMIELPSDCISRWLKKLEAKLKRDPNIFSR